jgi:raffinose/stachyose/melibiose transport system permease protein
MKPVINVSLVLITTSSLKSFDSIYVMTQGGPYHATEVMASHMYNRAFLSLDYGYGCAIGLMLFLLCIVFSLFWSRVFGPRKGEEYTE